MTARFSNGVKTFCLLLLLGCGQPEPPPQPSNEASLGKERGNILLITIDTLRADHLSAYGYPRETSPTLDRLAAEGVRFDRPMVQWPKTGPSFASIFTSLYPHHTGIVRKIGITVPRSYDLLAEKLNEAGYQTRAVVANGALSKEFNFDQGFDAYVETWKSEAAEGVDRDGAQNVTDLALELAKDFDDDRPFFLWVHYLDPHFPYQAPEPWTNYFVGDEHEQPEGILEVDTKKGHRQIGQIGYKQVLDGQTELSFYKSRYDSEIRYTDSQIERLLTGLTEWGRLEDTLTVVTSDHGESLGEHHYYFDHGRFAFQTCLRVPLIFHDPSRIAPRIVEEATPLINLSPTLLQFAGIELDDAVWNQGRSLIPQLQGETPVDPTAFSEAGYADGGRWQRVAQDERFKLVYAPTPKEHQFYGDGQESMVLFDLQADPEETVNLADTHRDEVRRLRTAMREWLAQGGEAQQREQSTEIDEETRRQLEALGYLQ